MATLLDDYRDMDVRGANIQNGHIVKGVYLRTIFEYEVVNHLRMRSGGYHEFT